MHFTTKKSSFLNLIFILFFVAFSSCIYAYNANENPSVYRPSYSEIEANLINLAQEHPDLVTRTVYGSSGKFKNLNLLRISKKENYFGLDNPGKAVYISGVTHGNEYLNVEDRLAVYFVENYQNLVHLKSFLDNGGTIYFVPIVNPDGYEEKIRSNSNGRDLNRDFSIQKENYIGFREPETLSLSNYLQNDLQQNNLKLIFTLDYHCCATSLIYPWSFPGTPMPSNDLKEHQIIGNFVQTIFGYRMGDSMDIFKLFGSGIGTSKDYFYETYHSLSFTFEGQKNTEYMNFEKHIQFWEEVFKYLNEQHM